MTHRNRIIGNVTLTLLALCLGLFYGWVKLTPHPADMPLTLFGIFALSLGKAQAALSIVAGWLSLAAVFSVKNLTKFARKPWDPLGAISDPHLQQLIASPGTLVLAAVLAVATTDVVIRNGVVALHTKYDIVLEAPPDGSARLLTAEGKVADLGIPLPPGEVAYLADLAPWSTGVLLIRDDYSLLTLEALCVRRGWLGSNVGPCVVEIPQASKRVRWPVQKKPLGIVQRDGFEVEIAGQLRGFGREVTVRYDEPLPDGGRRAYDPFVIGPGLPSNGPPRTDVPWANALFSAFHDKRAVLRDWFRNAWMEDPEGRRVIVSLPRYELAIYFKEAIVRLPGASTGFATREASLISVSALAPQSP